MSNYQVPEGYKQTEVGVIPEDWSVTTLGEIGQSLIGLTYRPADTRDFGTLVLRSSNVQNDRLAYDNNVFVDSALILPSRVIVEEGDILICVRNGSKKLIGKCALINKQVAGSAFGAFMSVYRTKNYGFVFYQFQSEVIQRQINEIMGATINQITTKDLVDFQIPLPPSEEEQSAIAATLSDVDALIASLDKLIAKQRHLKIATMQQLLTGKKRLPGFGEGKGYKQTEVGVIPDDWDVRELESLGAGTTPPIKAGPFGSALTKDTYVPIGYKVYGQEQVIRGDYLYGDYFISVDKFRQLESCAVRPGDILLSLVGTTGKVLVIPEDAPPGIINPRLIRLSFNKELVDPHFFRALFESGEIQAFLSRYSQGGTMGVLNAGTLRAVNVGLPSIEEQRAIATVLSDMDAAISALETRRAKTQAIKQGMMQQLLTGRVRLTIDSASQ